MDGRELDVFALLRIFMIDADYPNFHGEPCKHTYYRFRLFSALTLHYNAQLRELLDTRDGKIKNLTALGLMNRLIQLRYQVTEPADDTAITAAPEAFRQCYLHLDRKDLRERQYFCTILEAPEQFLEIFNFLAENPELDKAENFQLLLDAGSISAARYRLDILLRPKSPKDSFRTAELLRHAQQIIETTRETHKNVSTQPLLLRAL